MRSERHRHLSYIVSSILVPQFVGRREPLLLLLTTPPRDLDHDSNKVYWERARRDGSGLRIPGAKTPTGAKKMTSWSVKNCKPTATLSSIYERSNA